MNRDELVEFLNWIKINGYATDFCTDINILVDVYINQKPQTDIKPVIVRGGDFETKSVQLTEDDIKWQERNDTPNTPTEPLATEARDTVAEALDWDASIKPFATAEYKLTVAKIEKIERGGSAKGQP